VEFSETLFGIDPAFDSPMILLDDGVEIFDLADFDRRSVRLVRALDGGFIGVTAVDGNGLGETIAADGFLQKAQRGRFIAVLREQKVNRLPCLSTAR
jgi:hypothetical protein